MSSDQDAIDAAQQAADRAVAAADRATHAAQNASGLVNMVTALLEDLRSERQRKHEDEERQRQQAPKERHFFRETGDLLSKSFVYWSDWIQRAGLQLNAAIVAANWALWGSIAELRGNCWALWSLGLVGLGLVVDLCGAWLMSYWHAKRIDVAEGDKEQWELEATRVWNKNDYDPFPYTKAIERLGSFLRFLKMLLPILGIIALVIGAYIHVPQPPSPPPKAAPTTLRLLGSLDGFLPGDTLYRAASCERFMQEDWLREAERDSLGSIAFIVVGHVDKRPLRPGPQRIFGSNEALALARAKVVRRIMLHHMAHKGLGDVARRIVTLSSSADHVGISVDSLEMAADRSVVVYALMTDHTQ